MVIKLRSKRLADLFTEVWERLPKTDQTLLSRQTRLVIDNSNCLPQGQTAVWGAAISIGVRKSISIVYLSPHRLSRQSDDFVRYVIAYELAHILCGHVDQLFFSPFADSSDEECRERFESEADEQVRRWGFPIASPT